MDKSKIKKINKISAGVALAAVVVLESLFAFLLWLGDFDFVTRRPALAVAVAWAVAKGIAVFWVTLGLISAMLTEAIALKEWQQSRNP
jgi:predicted small integral membrane protein